MFRARPIRCSVVGVVLCAAPSFAQNLVTNPAFDDALNGWSTVGQDWSVVIDEADPCARVEVFLESASIWQCIPALEDKLYRQGALLRRAGGTVSEAVSHLTFYSWADCSAPISGPHVSVLALSSSWQGFWESTRAPLGTQSIRILVGTLPDSQGALLIDDVQLHEALFADEFETGALGRWSHVVGGASAGGHHTAPGLIGRRVPR